MSDRTDSDHVTRRACRTAAEPICRRLFTIEQAAEFAGVSVEWICVRIMTGEIKVLDLEGRIRIDEIELENFLSGQ